MERITPKQAEILEYIKKTLLKRGYSPAVRDICKAVGLSSPSSVQNHLNTLEEKGYIRKSPLHPRTIEIVDDNFNLSRRKIVNVPLVGSVAAGVPLLAEENIENYYPIPVELLPNAETFMLNVKGNSMVNADIFDGDQLIIERCSSASDGEIIVALVDDSATVKRFYKEDGYYRLQPENDEMEPILVNHLEILGKVIGLFRLGIN
ncbi:MAG: transcriptional repressor LexA [Clostridiaceae bacterium]|nr:transcriptional repressor LexA [Clostridiaceae bacterium]